MHVMVLGAGVTGITTAWYLLRAGHEVTVLERREGVALETSLANGGQISVSHPEPWSSPSAPLIALRSLGKPDAPLRFRFGRDWQRYAWTLAFLRECLPWRHWRNAAAIARLAVDSAHALQHLREQTGIVYKQRSLGIMHLLREPRALHEAPARIARLAAWGIRARLLTTAECLALEPALTHAPRLLGAIHAPDDESGDAHCFTRALAEHVIALGGRVCYQHTVSRLVCDRRQRLSRVLATDANGNTHELRADVVVVCLGCASRDLLAGVGVRAPIYPVKGYSITLPIIAPERLATASLTDESRRVVCSRLGDQLRVAGTAEIDGYRLRADPSRIRALCDWVEDFFPGATERTAAQPWAGLRPCTPSYVPLIGPTRIDGLWLNTGHGSLGWTLACGSAQRLTKQLGVHTASTLGSQ